MQSKRMSILFLMMMLVIRGAFAQESSPLTDSQMRERLEFIKTSLNEGERSATIWWWSWLGIYSVSTAGSFTLAAMSDGDTEKITYTVSGVQSALGVIGMLISPFAPRYAPERVRALPSGLHNEIETSYREAIRLFETAADDAALGRSWIAHALALAVNGGGALVIWKKYGDRIESDGGNPRKEAILNFVLGTIVSEIQIFTQPVKAIHDMREYRRRFESAHLDDEYGTVRYFAFPLEGGVSVGAAFSW